MYLSERVMQHTSHDAEVAGKRSAERTLRWRALLALLLISPAPSLGILANFYAGDAGPWLWGVAKFWLLAFPLAWHVLIDRHPISFSRPQHGGWTIAAVSGIVISLAIVAGYFIIGRTLLVPAEVRSALKPEALHQLPVFIGAAIYWITINSLLEEYVYRWFIFRKAEVLAGGWAAVVISALIFVIHHTIALVHYVEPLVTILSSIGIFIGGAIWSALYLKYRSIWIPWLSHAIVDIAVFGVAGWIIFGA